MDDGITEFDRVFYKYSYLMFGYTPPVDLYRSWNRQSDTRNIETRGF